MCFGRPRDGCTLATHSSIVTGDTKPESWEHHMNDDCRLKDVVAVRSYHIFTLRCVEARGVVSFGRCAASHAAAKRSTL